jgi:hypothetical protein
VQNLNPSKDMSVNCACQLCPDRVDFGSDDQTFCKAFGALKTTAEPEAEGPSPRRLDGFLPRARAAFAET